MWPSLMLLAWLAAAGAQAREVHVELAQTCLLPKQMAIIVNDNDPLSIKIGDYYREQRGIPAGNVIHVRFPFNTTTLPHCLFKEVLAEVERQATPLIQAYALAWTKPYRVDCMSITSAFSLGFDTAYCSTKCARTRPSGYFNSPSHAPFSDHKFRPSMMLAGQTFQDVKQLIARGIASDYTYPAGTGYLLNTSDKNRTVRAVFFEPAVKALEEVFRLQRLDANSIKDKKDVLFYFTGLVSVPDLQTLRFLPGAIADHLTSSGGKLTDSRQMSSLRFLDAGATGSYGTVVEPCNLLTKFPHPGVAMWRYAEGDTLIEAYWKSVAEPGEGVFIGEPLAKPFAPRLREVIDDHLTLDVFTPENKNLRLEIAASPVGPYRPVDLYLIKPGHNEVKIHLPKNAAFFRVNF